MKFTPKMIRKADDKINFIIGYRNLFNIVVLVLAFWFIVESQSVGLYGTIPGVIEGSIGTLLMVLGGKWFLSQIRQNLDILEIKEQLPPAPQKP
jgi:hypothetical protein